MVAHECVCMCVCLRVAWLRGSCSRSWGSDKLDCRLSLGGDCAPSWAAPILNSTRQPARTLPHHPPQWSKNMTQGLMPTTGFFNPSCYIHTAFSTTAPLIKGQSYMDVFTSWYKGEAGGHKAADDCGLTCNPTCPH